MMESDGSLSLPMKKALSSVWLQSKADDISTETALSLSLNLFLSSRILLLLLLTRSPLIFRESDFFHLRRFFRHFYFIHFTLLCNLNNIWIIIGLLLFVTLFILNDIRPTSKFFFFYLSFFNVIIIIFLFDNCKYLLDRIKKWKY